MQEIVVFIIIGAIVLFIAYKMYKAFTTHASSKCENCISTCDLQANNKSGKCKEV